jgi:exonuclease VII small subunit
VSQSNKREPTDEFDIFVANRVYPEANRIFGTTTRPIEEIKETAIIALDTNALLVPYNIGKESFAQIERTYEELVAHDRLIVPGQVAREFADNRARKLSELFQQLERRKNKVPQLQTGRYPFLESFDDYQKATELEREIDSKLDEYRQVMQRIIDQVRNWRWNDPVSILYGRLFNDRVIYEPDISTDDLQVDLKYRHTHRLPPGYKDAAKDDGGIGDLLIWHSILQIGKDRKSSVIFVSGDEKSDWWHKSEKQTLYPRYELVYEFARSSEGLDFHIMSFSGFLNLFGASEETVREVHEEEVQLRSVRSISTSAGRKAEAEFFFPDIRKHWANIVKGIDKRNLRALINMSKPLAFDGRHLVLGFDFPVLKEKFEQNPDAYKILENAIADELRLEPIVVSAVVISSWEEQASASEEDDIPF